MGTKPSVCGRSPSVESTFADAAKVFAGFHYDRIDGRHDYGEIRFITVGYLKGRFVVVTWTYRLGERRIISMRYGHADEEAVYKELLG